ncbi:histidine phosphatase family protein [Streptomyces sp. GSL17-111]|uniref:histidine phosphatase family protein n=1 Tax=Streptomyces sp. GSL17-111 TaxID=3121596 RepID=UPI0030F42DE7
MSVLLLVRHGQASFGAADYDALSEAGHEQARLLGASLAARGVVPGRLVRGALTRHAQTTAALLAGAGWADPPEVETDAGWDEFDHLRVMDAHTPLVDAAGRLASPRAFQELFEQATARWTGGQHDADYAEPFGAFTTRVDAALARAAERAPRSGTTLVVTSGGPVSLVVSRLLAGDASLWRALNPVTVNTGVTKVISGRRGLTCVTFNAHDHLDATPALLTYR